MPAPSRASSGSSLKLSEEARTLLARCSVLAGLPDDVRARLLAHAHIRSFASGRPIFRMGDEGDSMIAVLAGEVRISVASPEGRQITLARLGPGEVVGEIAMLDGRERTADATAATACTIAMLNRRDVLPVLQQHPAALLEIVRILCARLRATDQHIAEIALLPLSARLAKALLRIAGDDVAEKAAVNLSQRALGEIVGASRETVNKCLAEWQRLKLVQIDGTAITLLDRDGLERIAEPD